MSELMSALEALAADAPPIPPKTCYVGHVLSLLPPDEATALIRLIDTTNVPAVQIAQALTENGWPVQYGSVERHRRRAKGRGCQCPRE